MPNKIGSARDLQLRLSCDKGSLAYLSATLTLKSVRSEDEVQYVRTVATGQPTNLPFILIILFFALYENIFKQILLVNRIHLHSNPGVTALR